MTPLSVFFSYFPALVIVLALSNLLLLFKTGLIAYFFILIFVIYGLPVVVFQLHEKFFPLKNGSSLLSGPEYSPWWGSHQIQWVFIAFPCLETLLRAFPGLFSRWLRLWGSKIGNNIYWTPGITIGDRGKLELGDNLVFGQDVALSSHIIRVSKRGTKLLVKPIKIGSGTFLGAGTVLGPGVEIAPDSQVPIGTVLAGNVKFPN